MQKIHDLAVGGPYGGGPSAMVQWLIQPCLYVYVPKHAGRP